MNCPTCGNVLSDGTVFCESCGVRILREVSASAAPVAAAAAQPAMAKTPIEQPVEIPSAAALAQIGGVLLKRLSLGEKFAGAGALAGILGFFLPWASGPNLKSLGEISTVIGGSPMGMTSYSGFDFTKLWGGVYLILGAAIASAVLFFSARSAKLAKKLLISGFQVMIGSLIGPTIVFVLLFVPLMQSVAGIGLWLIGLGFSSMLAGGLVTIGHLGRLSRQA